MMKTICVLLAALMLSSVAYAQNDTISVAGSEVRIEAAGYGITVTDENQDFRGKPMHARRVSASFGLASFDIGFNTFTGLRYTGNWSGHGDFLSLNGWKSVRVAWEPAAVRVALDRRGVCMISAGLRVTADNFTFSNPYTLKMMPDGVIMPEVIEGYVRKSKMTAIMIGIPVKLTFKVADDVRLTASCAVEALLDSYTKYKRPIVKGNLPGVEGYRIAVGGSITYDQFGVYCEYGLSQFFKPGIGADANVLSIGLRLGI